MMKPILFALTLMALGVMAVGIYSRGGSAHNMTVRHNINDLPEHGLTIITASDPRFEEEMSAFMGEADGDLDRHLEATRPFCIFLRNTGTQEVVAYKLKWELADSDSRVMTKYSSTLNPAKLMGEEMPGHVESGREIRPNTSRFIAWEPSLTNILHSRRHDQGKPATPATQKRATILAGLGEAIRRQTESIISVTVSIDGAFFADGTFVGPDADNTFAEVQGYVESKLDLARIIEDGKREGKSPAAIIRQINSDFNSTDDAPGAHPTAQEFKTYFMKSHVSDLLRMRAALGDDSALEQASLPLRREKVRLRKKQ